MLGSRAKSLLHLPTQDDAAVKPAARFFGIDPPLAIDPGWILIEKGFQLAREHEIESIFTVANGYVGTRGSLAERNSLSRPATFLAGVFEASEESPAALELARLPDWTHLRILVEGAALSLDKGTILEHRRIFDLQHGALFRVWRHEDPAGRVTTVTFARTVSLYDRHFFFQSVTVTPENYAGTVSIESSLEAPGAKTQWTLQTHADAALLVGTTTRGTTIAMAHRGEIESAPAREQTSGIRGKSILQRWTWPASLGETVRFNRSVVVYSSRETRDPASAARRHLNTVFDAGLDVHVRHHAQAWEDRWRAAGLRIMGDDQAQRALRFAVYHLNGAVNPHDERTSIGARALTGKVYKGHVFWDTEIYLVPFYLFTDPPAARALLMYRFHTLPAARERARSLGYQGALYAWESADTGEDVTPASVVAPDGRIVQVLTGIQEHHISADIAYAVWQYWQVTADESFFLSAAIDILIETARFWATRGRLEADGHYHIRMVIGPDEYHESVDDNAYTNVMAQWNLERAADAAEWIRANRPEAWDTIVERLRITPEEPAAWRRVAGVIITGFDSRTNLFEQFAGYFGLEDLDLDAYRARTVPIDVILGHDRTQKSKVIKQADVVALSALLWDQFPLAVHDANFRYYEPRTAHGSSLSPAFHALVAARLGDRDLAMRYFHEAASIDLSTHMGNAAGGVHIAALGGLWQAAVFGMAGVRLREDGVVLDPHLPQAWNEFSFSLQWRGRTVAVDLTREPAQVVVTLRTGDPMTIALEGGKAAELDAEHSYVAHRAGSEWGDWQTKRR
jgi:trehalose/maltose hydrolase-like predicted phosphorylase